MKVHIYVASDDRKPKERERWTGYIIQAEGRGEAGSKEGAMSTISTWHQATIMMIIAVLDCFTRPAEITMHLDNGWITGNLIRYKQKDKTMKNTLEKWQENGWTTSRGDTVKNKDEWQRLYNKLRVFEQSGGTFKFERLEDDDRYSGRIMNVIKEMSAQG